MLVFDKLSAVQGGFTLHVDCSIAAGDKVSVIGPSGAGKSTLLSLLAGFVAPEAGRLIWDGEDLTQRLPHERPVTILFQDHNLLPHLTVSENLGLGLSPALRLTPEQHMKITDTLEAVGMQGLGKRVPHELSGGQQSRAALGRALLRRKPLLLLDEPFAALGPGLRQKMIALVLEVAAEAHATVLMVTHDPKDAFHLGGKTMFVSDGTAQAPVPTEALFEDPTPELSAYLSPD